MKYTRLSDDNQIDKEKEESTKHFPNLEEQRKRTIADLSHEFRTPLTNLNGYLRALQNGIIEGNEKLYHALYEESSKLIRIVEQLEMLEQSSNWGTQSKQEKEMVDSKEFIEKSVEIFRWSLIEKGIELKIDVDSSPVLIDPTSISQVINNLVDNAIRYYDGVEPISITGSCSEKMFKVSIRGPGIPITGVDREKIFERLYQGNASKLRKLGGSGLGLAISKEIIEEHQGEIGLDSDGQLHTFWFTVSLEN
ncbi:sensor histidine kinase [Oceanobacillus sp. CAU 1775]